MRKLAQVIGFQPKENAKDIFIKKYQDGYVIEIDFHREIINYGDKIICESKTTQNFSQAENFVVLECVNRLLEKGYKPENIILEPTWKLGHRDKGRLDILVKKEDKAYLMIECKTFGKEFDDELKKMKKDGGQLFSYFQQDKNAEILMLYTSELKNNKIDYKNEFIVINEDYRLAPTVKDFYTIWSKETLYQGFWENEPYNFKRKKFTKADLIELNEEASTKIFHEFASILRKHSVSDKPNAFNKIFNLFLAKLYDEAKGEDDELEFHWREDDNAVDFQVRLINLHRDGLFAFLEKEIEGIDERDFQANSKEELLEKKKKVLKFNNILAIKEVLDDASFDENHRVLKDVVKLLEKYQIRYPRKQQHLSDFFEKLLTTGLKQEVGQYFTPPPITKFIVRSLPIKEMILNEANNQVAKLPAVIDYAAGSGHFITEAMEEYQDVINAIDIEKDIKYPNAKNEISAWKANPYNWAAKYVYGIEKDYRLVKVAKVGCYFYGDGVAQIIHGDGLDSFETSKTYKGLLQKNTNLEDSTKAQFSLVLSNPPYSVNDCKDDLEYIGAQNDFILYPYLSEKSKDIECLFVERTKHLLKDEGIAAVVLPSSILNNTGIQTKTREIILQYFDIVAIAELGGNTFMATNTNTVTLFLRRRNNQDSIKLKNFVNTFFTEFIDNNPPQPYNFIEKPISKYVNYVWENISFDDYIALLKKEPTKAVIEHEIYREYRKKIKAKKDNEFWDKLIETEKDKLVHFVIAYNQKNIVLVKSGEKDAEKRFLGYYFSDRRGSEGMHAIQGGKTIDECTSLYNTEDINDITKANSYIYNAFIGNYNLDIAENLKNNISYIDLLDMLTFDRAEFHKEIKLSVKKKVNIESKWELERLDKIADIIKGVTYSKADQSLSETNKIILTADNITLNGDFEIKKKVFINESFNIPTEKKLSRNDIFICFSSGSKEHLGKVAFIEENTNYFAGGFMGIVRVNKNAKSKYIYQLLNSLLRQTIRDIGTGSNINNLSGIINEVKIPLPPIDIQQKIVSEIEVLEIKEKKAKEEVEKFNNEIILKIEKISTYSKENISNLFQINSKTLNPKELWEKELFTYIDIDALGRGDGKINFNQKLLGKEAPSRARRVAENNTTIISTVRPYLKGFGYIETVPEKTIFSTGFALLKSKDESKFITKLSFYLFMYSSDLMKQMESAMPKSAYPSINKEDIDNFKIPLPPITEQQKIVSEIEKIEAKIKVLETEISEIPKQKEAILKKYL